MLAPAAERGRYADNGRPIGIAAALSTDVRELEKERRYVRPRSFHC